MITTSTAQRRRSISEVVRAQRERMFVACRPLGPCSTSNSTRWFSSRSTTGARNRAEVRENVGGAVLGGDEAVALVGVEPGDDASSQIGRASCRERGERAGGGV